MKSVVAVFFFLLLLHCAKWCEATSSSDPNPRWLQVQPSRRYQVNTALKKQEVFTEHEFVQRFFKTLNKKEVKFLNKLLWENYAAGYYSALEGFSHKFEINHLREEAEKNLRKMRNGRIYANILRKARGEYKHHLLRHLVRRRESGEYDAYVRSLQRAEEVPYELKPEDIFYHNEEPVKIRISPTLKKNLPKFFFGGLFVLFAVATSVGLFGACFLKEKPIFRKIRFALEN